MPKFLHTADWQIGRQFHTFNAEDASPLAQARITAVERLAALAVAHNVDAVLVAGDVFDMQTVSELVIRRLFNAMSGYTGPWVLISGNHDAALAESVWTRARRLGAVPPHVHLALAPEPVLLLDGRVMVLPAPLTQRHTYADTTAWFEQAESPDACIRIGLAHGSVQGILADGIDSTNPIALDRAQQARLDYLALGDWHGTKRIDARTWYSGTPEPDRFKTNEAGHALLVEIAAAGAEPVVTVLETAQFDWQKIEHNLQVSSDMQELSSQLMGLGANAVVQLGLQGQLSLEDHGVLQALLGRISAQVRCLESDLTGLRLIPTDHDIQSLQADGYLAEVIEELRLEQAAEGDNAEVARQALAILTGAMAQDTRLLMGEPS